MRSILLPVLTLLLATATCTSGENRVVNAGFEDADSGSGWPSQYGVWSGDFASRSAGQGALLPLEGSWMLRFLYSGFGEAPSRDRIEGDIVQLIDVRDILEEIRDGSVLVTAEASFNRIFDNNEDTGRLFAIQIRAYTGSPSQFPDQADNFIVREKVYVISDDDPRTWQVRRADLVLPRETDYVAIVVNAREGDSNSGNPEPEFVGHFVDQVSLSVSVPTPIRSVSWGELKVHFPRP